MMPKKKYTEDQIAEMCALREEGKTLGQIRMHFARKGVTISESAISWHCLVLGADLPAGQRGRSTVRPGAIEKRGGHVVRRFSKEEDARILQLEGEGRTGAEIARDLGRKRNSIVGRLATLARREERAL